MAVYSLHTLNEKNVNGEAIWAVYKDEQLILHGFVYSECDKFIASVIDAGDFYREVSKEGTVNCNLSFVDYVVQKVACMIRLNHMKEAEEYLKKIVERESG